MPVPRRAICALSVLLVLALNSVAIAATSPGGKAAEPATAPAIRVASGRLVDSKGQTVQLRGANVAGLEYVAVQGWDPGNPWGSQSGTATPDWKLIKSWGMNVVRLPLNEASWLNLSCVTLGVAGTVVREGRSQAAHVGSHLQADPGGNYRATVLRSVNDALEAGLYVIVDLHWSAPDFICPMSQNSLADDSNAIPFWRSVADTFRNRPGVLFELFNEPTLTPDRSEHWELLLSGGDQEEILTGGNPATVRIPWRAAGMQAMLDAVRSTGARNVVLVSGLSYAGNLRRWMKYRPVDPIQQMAVAWHAYPAFNSTWGTSAYLETNAGPQAWHDVEAILEAGYPVVVTEFGDRNTQGTVGAPFAQRLLPWADRHGVSYVGWAWMISQSPCCVLIKDALGTPTPGYGEYVKSHYLCRAKGRPDCP